MSGDVLVPARVGGSTVGLQMTNNTLSVTDYRRYVGFYCTDVVLSAGA